MRNCENALARIPTDDGPTSEEVAAALTTLPKPAGPREGRRGRVRHAPRRRGGRIEEADPRRSEPTRAPRQRRSNTRSTRPQRPPLDEAARTAREQRTAVEQKHARCAELAAGLDQIRGQLDALRTEETERAQELESAREAEHRAAGEAASADEHLAVAQRAESAAPAAHHLHPRGCLSDSASRDLPADWEAPDGTKLIEARQVAKAAHDAAREATGKVTVLHTERKGIQGRIADAEIRLDAAETRFREARQELVRDIELDTDAPAARSGRAWLPPLEGGAQGDRRAPGRARSRRPKSCARTPSTRTRQRAWRRWPPPGPGALVERTRQAAEDSPEGTPRRGTEPSAALPTRPRSASRCLGPARSGYRSGRRADRVGTESRPGPGEAKK